MAKSIGQKLLDLFFTGYDDNLRSIKKANTMCPTDEHIKEVLLEAISLTTPALIRAQAGTKICIFSLTQTGTENPVMTNKINDFVIQGFIRTAAGTYNSLLSLGGAQTDSSTMFPENRLLYDASQHITGLIKIVPELSPVPKLNIYTYESGDNGVTFTLKDGIIKNDLFKITLYKNT